MFWRSCKRPPKKSGFYLLCFFFGEELSWDTAYYYKKIDKWAVKGKGTSKFIAIVKPENCFKYIDVKYPWFKKRK